MEILAALAIFAIGMVAAASLFPAAMSIQKATIAQVQATQAERNAKAAVMARQIILSNDANLNQFPYPLGTRNDAHQSPDIVHRFGNFVTGQPGNDFFKDWRPSDRAYPAATTNAAIGGASFYWVPFFIYHDDTSDPNNSNTNTLTKGDLVTIYIAVLQAQQTKNYADAGVIVKDPQGPYGNTAQGLAAMTKLILTPGDQSLNTVTVDPNSLPNYPNHTTQLSDLLDPGDQALLSNGTIITVKSIDGNVITASGLIKPVPPGDPAINAIWIGLPFGPNQANPLKAIFQLPGNQAVKVVTP